MISIYLFIYLLIYLFICLFVYLFIVIIIIIIIITTITSNITIIVNLIIINLHLGDPCKNDSVCHTNATCHSVIGSYICKCDSGYTGDGFVCSGWFNKKTFFY